MLKTISVPSVLVVIFPLALAFAAVKAAISATRGDTDSSALSRATPEGSLGEPETSRERTSAAF